ncbi:MAG TPA: ATP-binding protein [Mycobacteriales bacterium]|nr:ATP-binding protein [Mycobacteriales bacterium]
MKSATREVLTLVSSRQAPAEARRAVHDFATAVSPSTARTAELLASELVTNAVTHGRGEVRLVMEYDSDGLAVTVTDDEPAMPEVATASPAAQGGRGLRMVEVLSSAWGVKPDRRGHGKGVWFRLG